MPPTSYRRVHCFTSAAAPARSGWLNVDLVQSDFDVDLTGGRLPWKDESFQAALSQHVIEHLELRTELVPLLREIQRVLVTG